MSPLLQPPNLPLPPPFVYHYSPQNVKMVHSSTPPNFPTPAPAPAPPPVYHNPPQNLYMVQATLKAYAASESLWLADQPFRVRHAYLCKCFPGTDAKLVHTALHSSKGFVHQAALVHTLLPNQICPCPMTPAHQIYRFLETKLPCICTSSRGQNISCGLGCCVGTGNAHTHVNLNSCMSRFPAELLSGACSHKLHPVVFFFAVLVHLTVYLHVFTRYTVKPCPCPPILPPPPQPPNPLPNTHQVFVHQAVQSSH